MTMYDYPFNIDEKTRREMASLDTTGWYTVIDLILKYKPVPLNISFSEREPELKLKELYNAILKYSIESIDSFQHAIVIAVQSKYGNNYYIDECYALIRSIDYIKPIKYFNQLSLLFRLTLENNPNYVKATYNGLIIHHIFFDSLSTFDNNSELLNYFWRRRNSESGVSYYQVIFRYIVSSRKDLLISSFGEILYELENDSIKDTILDVFKEEVFYNESFLFLLNWAIDFPDQKNKFFILFKVYLIEEWISLPYYQEKYKSFSCFELINYILLGKDYKIDEWVNIFEKVAKNTEIDKKQVCFHFFQRNSLIWMDDDQLDYDLCFKVYDRLNNYQKNALENAISYAWPKVSKLRDKEISIRGSI